MARISGVVLSQRLFIFLSINVFYFLSINVFLLYTCIAGVVLLLRDDNGKKDLFIYRNEVKMARNFGVVLSLRDDNGKEALFI